MLRRRSLAIALVLLVTPTMSSWGQSKTSPMTSKGEQAQTQQQKPVGDQRGTEQFPLVVQSLPIPKTAEMAASEKRDADEKANSDWWTWFLGVLTIFALFGQLIVFVAQAYFLKGTLDATASAANAAKAAAEAVPGLERAYLFFSSATSDDFNPSMSFVGTSPDIFKINYRYKNSGRTPALLKRVQIGCGYFEKGFPTNGVFNYDSDLPTVHVIEGGLEPPPNDVQLFVQGDEYEKAKDFMGRYFFWGKLTYLDVFGISHETGICSEWHFGQNRFVVSHCKELNYYT
jgi:hypothetical protein